MFPVDRSDLKPLGRTREKVPAIGLGTWAIRDYSRAERALVRAVELGMNVIDTAEMYGDGLAEELVGRVVRSVGRDRVFITTKLLPERFSSVDEALKAMRASLRRLGVRAVDLVLIHWPRMLTPISEQVKVLEELAERGYARYIGVSNFGLKELAEAIGSTRKHEIVVNQVKYSVFDRSVERDLLPYAIRHGVTVQAYTPLERGRVASDRLLAEVGRRYGKSAVQVALNYLISRPMVTAIPKTERVERVEEFRGAMGWRLDPEDIERLERARRSLLPF